MGASQAFASQPTCLIFRAAMASRRSVRIIIDGSKLEATLVSRLKISTVVAIPTHPPRLHHRPVHRPIYTEHRGYYFRRYEPPRFAGNEHGVGPRARRARNGGGFLCR